MARGVRVQEGENLSATNIEKVIALLEPSEGKPITKVVACEILNISYNTSRLNAIIAKHKEAIEIQKTMRKKMRTEPIDISTASTIVSMYLSGSSLQDISDETYRSVTVIKRVLSKYNIPVRNKSVDYQHPIFIENDEAIKDDYVKGDLVYSARYDKPATVSYGQLSKNDGMVYLLWLHGVDRKQIFQPYYELADLRRIQKELNIKMHDLNHDEVYTILNEAMRNQKKQDDKRK